MQNQFSKEQSFLYSYLQPYKAKVALFLGGSLLVSIFDGISIGMLIPALGYLQGSNTPNSHSPEGLQWLSDIFMMFPQENQFIFVIGLIVLSVLIKNILLGLTYQQGASLSNGVTSDMRLDIVKTLLTVGIDFHHKSKRGELIEKTTAYTQVLKELIIGGVTFLVFLLMLFVLLSLLMVISWQLTVLVFFLGLVCMLVMSKYMKKIAHLSERAAKSSAAFTAAVQENYSAVELIQLCSQEQQQINKLKKNIQHSLQANYNIDVHNFWLQPMTEALGMLSIGALFGIAFFFLPLGELSFAIVIPYLYILIRIVTTLKVLNDTRGVLKARWPYLKLVYKLADKTDKPFLSEGDKKFNKLKQEISFQKVCFSYSNDTKYVLQEMSFSIPVGKTTAIVGKSGSGKSTIVSLLLRCYDPQQGDIVIDGVSLTDFQLDTYRKKIGVVSQSTFIFHDTIMNNIAFGCEPEASKEDIINAAKKAAAHDFIIKLPDGYDTVLGDGGVNMSGGQRQRISIARAILKSPDILILDEATSALDTLTEKMIHDSIADLSQNRTVIIIAHRLSTIENADQVIVLKEGKLAEKGTAQQLFDLKKEYYSLVRRHT
ncbi:MAG: ATP-binding cassette domain-containing protein [Methyloprofundus sp.]|nr:ATP-binding cassette domain-containing protein [Methyloprofundus sp.]